MIYISKHSILIFFCFYIFNSCSHKMYSGPKLPKNKTCMVKGKYHFWLIEASEIKIYKINDNSNLIFNKIFLLPGKYEIVVFLSKSIALPTGGSVNHKHIPYKFKMICEAGKTYIIEGSSTTLFETNNGFQDALYVIREKDSNEVIARSPYN